MDSVPSIDITNNSSSDDYDLGLDGYDTDGASSGSDFAEGCNPAPWATFDDFRCGTAGGDEFTEDCNPAPWATFDDFRCGSTTDSGFDSGPRPFPISSDRCAEALYEWAQSGYLSPSDELYIDLYCDAPGETFTGGTSYPISRDRCAEALAEFADSNFLSPSAELDIDLYC